MSATVILENLSSTLYRMFDKKKFGIEFTEEEMSLISKFKNSRLIRTLIDPTVDFDLGDYVPPRIEIEIALSIISGRPVINFTDMSLSEMTKLVYTALSCGQELYVLFKKNVS